MRTINKHGKPQKNQATKPGFFLAYNRVEREDRFVQSTVKIFDDVHEFLLEVMKIWTAERNQVLKSYNR